LAALAALELLLTSLGREPRTPVAVAVAPILGVSLGVAALVGAEREVQAEDQPAGQGQPVALVALQTLVVAVERMVSAEPVVQAAPASSLFATLTPLLLQQLPLVHRL
jgi:hypothetical protein